jgi:hypothetical protein
MVRNASGALSKCPFPFLIPLLLLPGFPWLKRRYRLRLILGMIASEKSVPLFRINRYSAFSSSALAGAT